MAVSHATLPDRRYTSTAVLLHWIIAGLFIVSYLAVYYRRWFTEPKTPENITALQIHLAIGVTIAAFVALRVLWRLMHAPLPLEPGSRWQHTAAHALHYLLYAFMIVMPITGYLGAGANGDYFGIPKFANMQLFQWLVVERLGLTFEEWEKPLDFIHERSGAYLLWVLILGHAAAALYHHSVLKDATLKRMLPRSH